MAIPIYQVDAFTDRPFAGNPAAVCILRAPAEAAWMQTVVREMNLSETAFLCPHADGYEDPVCGSARCCLGPFWQRRLGKAALTAYQASARGGTVRVRVAGERVHVGGQAVNVLRGELEMPNSLRP